MTIFNPDGSEVAEIVLPDGSTASEVVAPDGSVVFSGTPAIPDSAIAHYVADNISASDTDVINTWQDELATGDLTGGDPVYNADSIGGLASVDFDRSRDDTLSVDFSSNVSGPITIFGVCNAADIGSGSERRSTLIGQTGGGDFRVQKEYDNNRYVVVGTDGTFYTGGTATQQNEILTIIFDGANSKLRVNGADIASGDTGSNSVAGILIGAITGREGISFDGPFSELVWCDGRVSDSDIQTEEQRLSDKYGIAV